MKSIRRKSTWLVVTVAIVALGLLALPAVLTWAGVCATQGYFNPVFWSISQTLALILTLVLLATYARDTRRIANLQEEELGLRKQPVVSFHTREYAERERKRFGEFLTKIENHSNTHASARFEVSFRSSDRPNWILLSTLHPDNNRYIYGGDRVWSVQANATFNGSLELRESLGILRDNEAENRLSEAWLRVVSWSRPFGEVAAGTREEWVENPTQFFRWNRGKWEPEPDGPEETKPA